MALPYFYWPEPISGSMLTLDEANSKHMVSVLRMEKGEALHLTDGRGHLYTAEIVDPHKKKCTVAIRSVEYSEHRKARVTIAISPLKNVSRMEWFLEKATEIGVAEIIPLLCQRTEKQHIRHDRMQQILVSAMLQSQQVWLPELQEMLAFSVVLSRSEYDRRYIAHCLPELRQSLRTLGPATTRQLLLIGPEGDFSPDEIQQALHQGFEPVALGENRLRTETAGIVGATLLCIG